jgi:pimeloyl-ACP methyl ester carboxylesterase
MQHGYLGSHELWRAQIDYFSEFFDVITPDLAGFGLSNQLQAPESISECATNVFNLLDHLEVEEFFLMGHSMGGMTVQQMALIQPRRVKKLICFGTGPVGQLPNRFETLDESRSRILEMGAQKAAEKIAQSWFINGADHPGYQTCLDISAEATDQAALACLTAWGNWNVLEELPNIEMPTLIVWGDHDRSYGWSQPQALWQGIKDSQLAVLPGCAHNAHMEKPSMFNLIVDDFLRG